MAKIQRTIIEVDLVTEAIVPDVGIRVPNFRFELGRLR
jgi:hypothetical protein